MAIKVGSIGRMGLMVRGVADGGVNWRRANLGSLPRLAGNVDRSPPPPPPRCNVGETSRAEWKSTTCAARLNLGIAGGFDETVTSRAIAVTWMASDSSRGLIAVGLRK